MDLLNDTITFDQINDIFISKGYDLELESKNDLFLFGIRSNMPSKDKNFNDYIGYIYVDNDSNKTVKIFRGLTDPEPTFFIRPTFSIGVMYLAEGFYPECWTLGNYYGKKALMQIGKMTVGFDNRRNGDLTFVGNKELDVIPVMPLANMIERQLEENKSELFHIVLPARDLKKDIYFHGEQVIRNEKDYKEVMSLVSLLSPNNKLKKIGYALFNENDFID